MQDGGAWCVGVYGVKNCRTGLSNWTGTICVLSHRGFPVGTVVKNLPAGDSGNIGSISGKIPWRRKWQLSPVFLPGESHRHRSLVGYSPQGCKESDTPEGTEHTAHTQWATGSQIRLTLDALRMAPLGWVFSWGFFNNESSILCKSLAFKLLNHIKKYIFNHSPIHTLSLKTFLR